MFKTQNSKLKTQNSKLKTQNSASPLLRMSNINTYYGPIHILQDVNLEIYPGELVCLLGGNASGKSTTLKTILGLVKSVTGSVEFQGEPVNDRPTSYRIERGMAVVPENRRIFGEMNVRENLLMGAYLRTDKQAMQEDLERVLQLFPRLKERFSQLGSTLSGGEQQMLALGRALMSRPKLLLMDEPSMGLAPILVEQSFELIQQINEQGVTVFMVEQNANMALAIADRGYVLSTGRVVLTDKAENLLNNEQMRKAYLGR
jgi:branched-chain amino acid transport system ATP-binding protein